MCLKVRANNNRQSIEFFPDPGKPSLAAGILSMIDPGMCSIRLVGCPEIVGLPPGTIFPAKGFQLLALLTLAPDRQMKRRRIASLLWEKGDEAAALTNSRQLLSRLRRTVPAEWRLIDVGARELMLEDHFDIIDLTRILKLSETGSEAEVGSVLPLFRGELLSGLDDVGEDFGFWLHTERARLREIFFTAASGLLMRLTRFGRAPVADLKAIAEAMLTFEPEREATYRVLIEAYGRNGMLAEAKSLYVAMAGMLRLEHATSPSFETQAVARKVFASLPMRAMQTTASDAPNKMPRIAFLKPIWLGTGEPPVLGTALIQDVADGLSRYRSFRALAPHSSFQVDHDSGLPLDNARLKADYTVSGHVRAAKVSSVLTLRMVNCASQEIVWAGEFPFDIDALRRSFRLLSERVTASLASGLERDLLEVARIQQTERAYIHLLSGQRELDICHLPNIRRARKSFEMAIAEDRNYSSAYGRLAQALYLEWLMLGADVPELVIAARRNAQAAIDTDPNNALGHWVAGAIAFYQRSFEEARSLFDTAEVLAPNSADMLVEYADMLAHVGSPGEGAERFDQAISLNPMPPDHYWWAGATIAFNSGDIATTIERCLRMHNDEAVLRLLTASYALAGEIGRARDYGRRLLATYPSQTAADMVGISPDIDPAISERFIEGLRLAGIR